MNRQRLTVAQWTFVADNYITFSILQSHYTPISYTHDIRILIFIIGRHSDIFRMAIGIYSFHCNCRRTSGKQS